MKKYTEKDTQVRRSDLNEIIDRVNGLPRLNSPKGSAFVRVQNNTGYALPPFSILAVEGNSFSDSANFYSVNRNTGVILQGSVPSEESEVVITLESCAVGGVAACAASGVVPCRIDVQDTSHEYAVPDDTEKLQSAASGNIRILSTVSSTGTLWGVVLLNHRKAPCRVSYDGVPADIPENTPWDAAVANRAGWSYNATRETFEENGTLPPFRNPLQLPLDAPLLVMNLAGCGPTAVSCSPFRMICVNEDTTNLNVGDVFQEGGRLFVVKVKPPSGTHSGRLYAPVACKPLEECSFDEVTVEAEGGISMAPPFYRFDSQNHRMVFGIGPWTIEAGHFVYRTQYFGTAMYAPNFHAGMVLWNGHEMPLSSESLYQGAWGNLVPDLYHGDLVEVRIEVYQESNALTLHAKFLSGPLDHRPGTILYALNQPGRGWTRVDPPDSYKLTKNACVPAFCLDGTWLSDGASHQIHLPDSTTSTTFNFTVLGSFWQKQQSPDM